VFWLRRSVGLGNAQIGNGRLFNITRDSRRLEAELFLLVPGKRRRPADLFVGVLIVSVLSERDGAHGGFHRFVQIGLQGS